MMVRMKVGQSENMQILNISLHPSMCKENHEECDNLTSNIFTDTQVQLSCATLTRYNIYNEILLENDRTMDYEVGEEIKGGVTLPDLNI